VLQHVNGRNGTASIPGNHKSGAMATRDATHESEEIEDVKLECDHTTVHEEVSQLCNIARHILSLHHLSELENFLG